MMFEGPVVLAALVLDAALGWPAWLYARIGHPVGGFAAIVGWCAARWNRQEHSAHRRRVMGCVTLAILLAVAGAAGLLASALEPTIAALAAWPALAQRSLYQHVRSVAEALDAGDLPEARRAVRRIVGRDVDRLDEEGVARAAIESLAESFCDGVVAPWFWLLAGGPAGIWSYKAVNTADSLIGHREPPWGPFGWAAARADDVANWLPARLAAVLICLAGGAGWRVLWRDHGAHASPNAGWSEAGMAGALGTRLGGPVHYDGEPAARPWMGDGAAPDGKALHRALAIYLRACAGLWVLTAALPVSGLLAVRALWLR